jgi:hypothetical protein
MLPTIRRFLMTLAVLGLVLAPLAQPAMAMSADQSAGMDHHAMMAGMADHAEMAMLESMPCCPDEAPMPDCGKHCLMLMCAASLSPILPSAAWLAMPLAAATELIAGGDSTLSGRSPTPPPRPPKA